jgi:hypothetical protein
MTSTPPIVCATLIRPTNAQVEAGYAPVNGLKMYNGLAFSNLPE